MRGIRGSVHSLLAACLIWCAAPREPALAVPIKVTVRLVGDIDPVLSAVEAEIIKKAGSAGQRVAGVTLRLKNYLEDVVVLAGKTTVVHPPAIITLIESELSKGTDKRVIAMKLVELQRQGKL